jgi:hypothetical protein
VNTTGTERRRSPGRGASVAAAALLVVATLLSLGLQWHDAHRMPEHDVVVAANQAISGEVGDRDAVRVAPGWFDTARIGFDTRHLMLGTDLDEYDRHRFDRLWLLSSASHAAVAARDRAAWLRETEVRFEQSGYRIEVGRVTQTDTVLWDGLEQIRQARVERQPLQKGAPVACSRWDANAWQCGRVDPYLFVGPVFREMDESFRECVSANALPRGQRWSVLWSQVPLGSKLRFKAGNTYLAHRSPRGSVVHLSVLLNGIEVAKRDFMPHELGYPETVVDTAALRGGIGDIEFRVWAEDHFDRFFCFRPQTLDTAR